MKIESKLCPILHMRPGWQEVVIGETVIKTLWTPCLERANVDFTYPQGIEKEEDLLKWYREKFNVPDFVEPVREIEECSAHAFGPVTVKVKLEWFVTTIPE